MSAEELATHVAELAASKLEKPKRLREAAARDWSEIEGRTLRFDRPEAEVAALRALTLPELATFYEARRCWGRVALLRVCCVLR